jgi:hypothetical protein
MQFHLASLKLHKKWLPFHHIIFSEFLAELRFDIGMMEG